MIVGMGIDVVSVAGFAEQLADPASHFERRTFTEGEIAYCRGRTAAPAAGGAARHLAGRYAAKEAAVKALDLACARLGVTVSAVDLREIEVARDASGRPRLELHGRAQEIAVHVGADRAWVSLTHDGDVAAAVVTLEHLADAVRLDGDPGVARAVLGIAGGDPQRPPSPSPGPRDVGPVGGGPVDVDDPDGFDGDDICDRLGPESGSAVARRA